MRSLYVIAVGLGLAACGAERPPSQSPKTEEAPAPVEATSTPSPPPTSATTTDPPAYADGSDSDPLAAPPSDARVEPSGLKSVVLRPGQGQVHPLPTDRVRVHYAGWRVETGEMFDSSYKRGRAATFRVNGVIQGWTEALQLMVEGEQRRIWVPAELAYGDEPARSGAPAGDLVFEVELLEVIPGVPPPPTPANLTPPPDAKTTPSGLAYKWLRRGKGTVHPRPEDRIRCHYTGWTTDGTLFDSSVLRDKPATFPLKDVIPGWTEGVQLMVEGDILRLWIPASLAFGNRPKRTGAPAGDLVFDVELLNITPPSP